MVLKAMSGLNKPVLLSRVLLQMFRGVIIVA